MTAYKKIKKVPFLSFIKNSGTITKDPIGHHQLFYKKYGDTFTILQLKNPVVLSREVAVAQHILKKNHKNYHKSPYQSKNLSEYIGNGLLTANGAYWLKQRRLIQPAFHRERLERLLAIIAQTVEKQLADLPRNKTVEVLPLMSTLAFDVVAKSLFQVATIDEKMEELKHIIAEIQEFIVTEIRQPHKRWWFWLNGSKGRHMQLVKKSRNIVLSLIQERRKSEVSATHHDDLLQMLLEARYEDGTQMDDETLIDEIIILFVAGHETTANALTFALRLLANHPEAVVQIREEATAAMTGTEDLMARMSQYKYTRACVEEAMRLYPPAWITDRVALEDDEIAGYKIKKGTTVGVSFYEIHRNPSLWEQPEAFRPERFLEENRKEISGHYFPFGAGPRFCIGNNFALYEMIMAIAQIATQFELQDHTKAMTLKPLITLKPEGVKMTFVDL